MLAACRSTDGEVFDLPVRTDYAGDDKTGKFPVSSFEFRDGRNGSRELLFFRGTNFVVVLGNEDDSLSRCIAPQNARIFLLVPMGGAEGILLEAQDGRDIGDRAGANGDHR